MWNWDCSRRGLTTTEVCKIWIVINNHEAYYCFLQCCRILSALGVPFVASPGEAEAMCAFLDAVNVSSFRCLGLLLTCVVVSSGRRFTSLLPVSPEPLNLNIWSSCLVIIAVIPNNWLGEYRCFCFGSQLLHKVLRTWRISITDNGLAL